MKNKIFYTLGQNILHPWTKYTTPLDKIYYTLGQNILHPWTKVQIQPEKSEKDATSIPLTHKYITVHWYRQSCSGLS
jgi:hypothetical protein